MNQILKNNMQNALNLAFIGDSVFAQMVKMHVIETVEGKINKLHHESNKFIKATFQARAFDAIEPMLTEEETALAKRARNVPNANIPKNATAEQYKKSTSLEAIFGLLYLTKNHSRLQELFDVITNLKS